MEKTIEERAEEYSKTNKIYEDILSVTSVEATLKRGYIDGAKAQKEIDIDKVWEWLEKNSIPVSWDKDKRSLFIYLDEKQFRKAMED